MTRYVLRRVAFSLVTLWLVVTIVFMINNVFPSDIGRRLAGPFQSQEVVDQIKTVPTGRFGPFSDVPAQPIEILRISRAK